jgi:hypothetical protein
VRIIIEVGVYIFDPPPRGNIGSKLVRGKYEKGARKRGVSVKAKRRKKKAKGKIQRG